MFLQPYNRIVYGINTDLTPRIVIFNNKDTNEMLHVSEVISGNRIKKDMQEKTFC
jgi:hypothetical protein